MREVTRIVYEAFDGEMFDSEAKCAAYEKENVWRQIIGLTEDQVSAALQLHPAVTRISEALVTVGYRIANMNRGKKPPKAKPDNEPYLPHPIGPEDEPPEPTYPDPMTAEQAERRVRT